MWRFFYQRSFQKIVLQALFAVFFILFLFYLYRNMIQALASRDLLPSFYFLDLTAGFDIGESLIEYSRTSSYAKALIVGILNTLLISCIGVILSTFLGTIIGVFRLSSHFLLRTIGRVYIAITRNVPLLVILIFIKTALFNQLPRVQEAFVFFGNLFISNRGVTFPILTHTSSSSFYLWIVLALLIFSALIICFLRKRGVSHPFLKGSASFLVLASVLFFLLPSLPFEISTPVFEGFNYRGGLTLSPEFLAVLSGLVLYHSAFIAEIVRSGIQSLPRGQREAALALGLSSFQSLRLVIFPQAIQVIIPPMISIYLNLLKNSSLAAYIGYPDLFSIAGTIFNQTGRSIEVILLLMAVYLFFSLLTSFILNLYNRKVRKQCAR